MASDRLDAFCREVSIAAFQEREEAAMARRSERFSGRDAGRRLAPSGREADDSDAAADDRRVAADGGPEDDLAELEGNALAEKTAEIIDWIRPQANALLLAAAGAVLATAAWILVSSQQEATRAQSWEAYLAGLTTGQSAAFDEVIRRYPDTPAANWSQLVLADMALTEASDLAFSDKERATPRLQAAAGLYSAILGSKPVGMLAERATFGLAKAREGLGQLEEARLGYEAVSREFAGGPMARMAAEHAVELGRESTRQWYDWFAAQSIKPPAAKQPEAGLTTPEAGTTPAEPAATPAATQE
jgi:hypothetical protein